MTFLCPHCHQRLPAPEGGYATCLGCGLTVNVALAITQAGAWMHPLEQDLTGQQVGNYTLGPMLGAGGMGVVYRAAGALNAAPVAIKLLYPHLLAQPELMARFEREALTLQRLVHPRIVRFVERGESQGRPFLVMEFAPGKNLDEHMGPGSMEAGAATLLVRQLAEALAAAHAVGIVHRDLKPANVVMTPQGPVVLDFGIALLGAGELTTLTHSDALLGTYNYMAPEQRTHAHALDARADIYSLGVIYYRLLTGMLPLGSFEPAHELQQGVSHRHSALVERMLQRNPDKRQENAVALMRELDALMAPRSRAALWVTALIPLMGAAGYWGWQQQQSVVIPQALVGDAPDAGGIAASSTLQAPAPAPPLVPPTAQGVALPVKKRATKPAAQGKVAPRGKRAGPVD